MYNIVMAGIDFNNSSLELREKVNFTAKGLRRAYEKIKEEAVLKECIIISTCNRSEIYAVIEGYNGREYIKHFYSSFFNIGSGEIEKNLVYRCGDEAINHIFEVASGFKSMILGEDQILGQVKEAYNEALSNKASGRVLNRLFLSAVTTAKKIKTVTDISQISTSVSAIGIKLVNRFLGGLKGKKVLVVGLGKMSKLAITYLLDEGVDEIFVTNRTHCKVVEFEAISPKVTGIDFQHRYKVINDVDILVSGTSAPHFVIHKDEFVENYNGKPFCILDLSLPRDVEPSIGDINGVTLYIIDDLQKISKENTEKRISAYNEGMKIIKEDIEKYKEKVKADNERLARYSEVHTLDAAAGSE
ncbi:MAG: glutamyl-tRNA reductase [Bacillota bacterium]|nr:glutamyl-tRNA reductase [Bacillota bacterium]